MILPYLLALATISPTPTFPPPSPATKVDEIQKIREVVQQKVREKLRQIVGPTLVKKGLIGKVIQIDTQIITIEYANTIHQLSLDDTTTYIDLKRNKTTRDKIVVGRDILAMGTYNEEDQSFLVSRIVFVDLDTVIHKKIAVIGKIADISKTSAIFTLIPTNNKDNLYQIKTTTQTQIVGPSDKTLKSTDLRSGDRLIAILEPDIKISKSYTALKLINLDYTPSPTPTKK